MTRCRTSFVAGSTNLDTGLASFLLPIGLALVVLVISWLIMLPPPTPSADEGAQKVRRRALIALATLTYVLGWTEVGWSSAGA